MFSWLKKKPVVKLKQGRKHVIHDELWTFVDNYIPGNDGDCDNDEKTIRSQEGLSEKRRLVVTIHELLHAFCWLLSEAAGDRFAEEMGEISVREDWREAEDITL